TIPTDKVQPGDNVTVEVTDKAGNTGKDTEVAGPLTYGDNTAPEVEITEVSVVDTNSPADGKADEVTIKGTSDEPNAQFTVKDKDGNTIGTGTTDLNGNFEITIPTDKVQPGDNVTVEVVDKAGNTGSDNENAGKLTYTDNTAPVVDIIGSEVVEGQEATIKAFISKVQFKDLTITLSNGAIIIIEAGKLEGSVNIQTQRVDDAYKQGETTEKVFISSTSNPDINIVGKEATIKISDDSDVTTVKITAAETTEKVITIDNLQNNQGFTVTAKDPYGAAATISTHTDPAGFGVLSNAEKPYIGQTDAIYSGHTSEIGVVKDKQTGKYLSETIEVEFKNPIQTLDVSFSWRDSKETARVDFYNGDKKVGYAVISGGGTNTSATIKYYDEKGILKSSVSVQGGTDAVDSVYTFKPAGDVTFTKAVFSAEGAGSDYLINSITYKEVVDGQNTTIVGSNEVAFKIETSNIPDPSKYDFKTTFPTAHVKIVDGSNNIVFEGDVNLDKDGKAIVSVRTDGTKDLTATVSDVQGNFEKVDYSDAFTTIVSSLSPQAGNDSITILEDTSYTLKSTDFGDNNQNVAKIKFTELPENGKIYVLKSEYIGSINDRAQYTSSENKIYVEIKVSDIVDISQINKGNVIFVPNKDTDDDGNFKFSVSNGNGNFSGNYTTDIIVKAVADAPTVSIDVSKVGETTIVVDGNGNNTSDGNSNNSSNNGSGNSSVDIPDTWWNGLTELTKSDVINGTVTYEKDSVDWSNKPNFSSKNDVVSIKTLTSSGGNIDTGEGNDSIYIENPGSAKITAGIGDDTVLLGNMAGSGIDLGDGNDKLDIKGNVTGGSITAGDGNDEIRIDGYTSIKVDLGDGNNKLHVKSSSGGNIIGNSGADKVLIEVDTSSTDINLGSGVNEVYIGGNSSSTITTQDGNDKVIIKGNSTNTIDLGAGDDILNIKGNGNNSSHIKTGDGNDKVLIEGNTTNIIELGSGNDELHIKGNAQGSHIKTEDGNDRVIIDGIATNTIELGNGDDYLEIGGRFSGKLDGGEGIDSLYLRDYTVAEIKSIMEDSSKSWIIHSFENIKGKDGMYRGDEKAFETPKTVTTIKAVEYKVDIGSSLTDRDGSETLTVVIKNVPETATLESSTYEVSKNSDGSYTVKVPAGIKDISDSITMKVPQSYKGDINLQIEAKSTETRDNEDGQNFKIATDSDAVVTTIDETSNITVNKGEKTNLVLTVDVSGSMAVYGNGAIIDKEKGITRLDVVKQSLISTIETYKAAGDTMVNITLFANGALNKGWMSADNAIKYINSLSMDKNFNIYEGTSKISLKASSTDYSKALEETGKVNISGSGQADAKTVGYFISDGQPQTSSQQKAVDSDTDTAIVNWKKFIDKNNIDLKVIGVGTAEDNADALKYLKSVQVMSHDEVIVINEPSSIETVMLSTVEGTVFGDVTDNFSGGDGNVTIDSIEIGNKIYTKDTMPIGGVKLDGEGKLLFDFTTGKYAYNGNGIDIKEDSTKSFKVNVSDEDGDKDSINVNFELNKDQIKDGIINFNEDGDINFSNLKNITEINLDNGEENKLSLTLKDVLDIGKKDGDGKINLTILGDDKDTVSFKDTVKEDGSKNAWSKTEGTGTDKGYDIYINSGDPTVQVKVEHPISDGITH
ncbi:immunoglobulin-like domain-containing protein, partial [Aliarcobacter butzleri]|uniref:immunoglobulin-like domain-containing protein n=1 Tax=Aliarcobacter butzleri TaxID=28197 RepID=UPI0021B30AF8